MNRYWGKISLRSFCFSVAFLVFLIIGREATAAQLTLSWGDVSSNEDGFKIERKTGTVGTFAQVGATAVNTTIYPDSNLPDGTTYCYRVRAYNTAGDSAYSNEACGSTPPAPFTLTVAKSGTGQGTITSSPTGISCDSDCSESYTSTTSVTLSAAPTAGSTFSGWSGGGCSGTGTCTLLMNTTTSVTATFTATTTTTYTLSVTKVGSGMVISSPAGISCDADCSEPYASGAVVSLTATPATGYGFSGWSGACTGTGACAVTLNANTTVTATFTATPTTSPTGLVAAYSFGAGSGKTVKDSSGLNNTGTISGATWTTSGKFGKALSFDGVNDRVTVNDAASLDLTTGMTVEAWVFPTAQGTSWRNVLIKERTGGETYNLYANTDMKVPTAFVIRTSAPSVPVEVRGSTQIPLSTWTHLAATYDGATLRLFANGTQISSRALTGSLLTSSGVLRIGGNSIWGEYFKGRIDEVRIYNRALTAAQITTDMTTAVTP